MKNFYKKIIILSFLLISCSPKLGNYFVVCNAFNLPEQEEIIYYGYSWPGKLIYLFITDQLDTFSIGDTLKMKLYYTPECKKILLRKIY